MFICQLPKGEQLWWYKSIKAKLISEEVYSYENLRNAMESKIADIADLI